MTSASAEDQLSLVDSLVLTITVRKLQDARMRASSKAETADPNVIQKVYTINELGMKHVEGLVDQIRLILDNDDCWDDDNEDMMPHQKIDRANEECYRRGYGVILTLPLRARRQIGFASALYIGHRWNDADKSAFIKAGKLPVSLRPGGLKRLTPCLLIRIFPTLTRGDSSNGSPVYVSGLNLDKGPFPCLLLVDTAQPCERGKPKSHYLIPEELIDDTARLGLYTKKLAKHGVYQKVESAREVLQVSNEKDSPDEMTVEIKQDIIERGTDLSTLVTVPLDKLMVQENPDSLNALERFLDAHHNDIKPLSWAPHLGVDLEQDYVVTWAQMQPLVANQLSGDLNGKSWFAD